MSMLSCASEKSVAKGYQYYIDNKVLVSSKESKSEFCGMVKGSQEEPYFVRIDIEHPRRSKCDCPFTEGNRKICKHMIALYFLQFPEEARSYKEEVDAYWDKVEEYNEHIYERVEKYVYGLKKEQLRRDLLGMLYEAPDWLFERYVRDNVD